MTQHHPTPVTLSSFAHGSLHHALATVVSCHTSLCEACADLVLEEESALGALLEAISPEAMQEDAMERTLARALRAAPRSRVAPRLPRFLEGFSIPPQISDLPVQGRRWLSPRIWIAPLKAGADQGPECLYLLWANCKTLLPQHFHDGTEFVLVLHGRYSDGLQEYDVGDFVSRDGQNGSHAPRIPSATDCLCLIASEHPMQVASRSARIVQWLSGTPF